MRFIPSSETISENLAVLHLEICRNGWRVSEDSSFPRIAIADSRNAVEAKGEIQELKVGSANFTFAAYLTLDYAEHHQYYGGSAAQVLG